MLAEKNSSAVSRRAGGARCRRSDSLSDGDVLCARRGRAFFAALERLFAIKGREPGKPVALIAADTAMAFALAREVPAAARVLAKAFWPGPLTLVLPARDGIPAALIGDDGGVGVRVSSHPVARALATGHSVARSPRPARISRANRQPWIPPRRAVRSGIKLNVS